MKPLLLSFLLFLSACSSLPNKRLLKLPAKDFGVKSEVLRTNGYYYCEKTKVEYCKYFSGVTSGIVPDTNSKFDEKYIRAFILEKDGYCYFTGGLISSGIKRLPFESALNYCELVNDNNSFDSARVIFESRINNHYLLNSPTNEKGAFSITNNAITFQIYESGSERLQLKEYSGQILNDSTFIVNNEIAYFSFGKKQIRSISEVYHFKPFDINFEIPNRLRDYAKKQRK